MSMNQLLEAWQQKVGSQCQSTGCKVPCSVAFFFCYIQTLTIFIPDAQPSNHTVQSECTHTLTKTIKQRLVLYWIRLENRQTTVMEQMLLNECPVKTSGCKQSLLSSPVFFWAFWEPSSHADASSSSVGGRHQVSSERRQVVYSDTVSTLLNGPTPCAVRTAALYLRWRCRPTAAHLIWQQKVPLGFG